MTGVWRDNMVKHQPTTGASCPHSVLKLQHFHVQLQEVGPKVVRPDQNPFETLCLNPHGREFC